MVWQLSFGPVFSKCLALSLATVHFLFLSISSINSSFFGVQALPNDVGRFQVEYFFFHTISRPAPDQRHASSSTQPRKPNIHLRHQRGSHHAILTEKFCVRMGTRLNTNSAPLTKLRLFGRLNASLITPLPYLFNHGWFEFVVLDHEGVQVPRLSP